MVRALDHVPRRPISTTHADQVLEPDTRPPWAWGEAPAERTTAKPRGSRDAAAGLYGCA